MRKMLSVEEAIQLRKEIPLCSLYYADYKNSFGYDEHEVCDFFDGYADFLQELMEEDDRDGGNQFFDFLDEYDNDKNLEEWFYICDGLTMECGVEE